MSRVLEFSSALFSQTSLSSPTLISKYIFLSGFKMKSPRELHPRQGLACSKALTARSDRRRIQNLLVQVNQLTPRRRGLRGAKAMEEELHLLQEKPVAVLNFEADPPANVSDDSGLEVDVLQPPVDEVVTKTKAPLDPPAAEVALETPAIEVTTVAAASAGPLADDMVTVDPLAIEVVTVAGAATKPPADEIVAVVDTEVYCHICEDHTWLDLESHVLVHFTEGRKDEDPPSEFCPRPCFCSKHRIYLDSYAPKFGDKPISGQIDQVITGNRIDPSTVPGLNFWIETKNKQFVRPDPEDVGSFEHEFLPPDPEFRLEDGLHLGRRDLFGW